MSKKLFILSFIFAILAVPNFAQETFTHPTAAVSITLPAGWMYEADGDNMIAYPEEGGFAITFSVINVDDVDAALEEVDAMLQSQVENLELGEGQAYDVNGMAGIFVEGNADGVLLAVGVIDCPVEGACLMVGAWGDPEIIEKYGADILGIFNSISPAGE
ncbi:MAG: hypothetical protein IAE91_08600 [Ignavibacteriaceae bacterium]|nr:hypothetical protein [Ignavibacteriaceae bacterium]